MATRYPNLSSETKKHLIAHRCDVKDENAVKAKIRKLMASVHAANLGAGGQTGAADQKYMIGGCCLVIEVKWDLFIRGGLKQSQMQYLAAAAREGAFSMVIDRNNYNKFEAFITAMRDNMVNAIDIYYAYLDSKLYSRPPITIRSSDYAIAE